MKYFPLVSMALILFTYASVFSQYTYDTRSDSIDITHTDLHLDISDFAGQLLQGKAVIYAEAKVNGINRIRLDLMQLTVDSVKIGPQHLSFTQQTAYFDVWLPAVFNTGQSFQFEVFYKGVPHHDPDFGGFYFSGNYAYSVGVSLSNIPHNYGRTWFPCFDNFTERCTYTLYITTTDSRKAICGGILQSITPATLGKSTWHWEMSRSIPSYLISVAVADYEYLQKEYISITNDTIPVIWAARAADTTKMKNSFVNLHHAFNIFEQQFGPYRWDRVGYALVPMTAGAMEHAENIAYPVLLANNTTTYQDVMAHELSHHWWGNLVTCRTAEDMWINEGMAVFCEYVFNEHLYGQLSYKNLVRNAHKKNLQLAHINDNGYWPLSGIPQNHTYSTTTYAKGADMVHSLRGYCGDSLFFGALNHILLTYAYQDIDAWQFRDAVSTYTGMNASDFFNDWIFQGGWPWFGIDSVFSQPSGSDFIVTLFARQKLAGRSSYSSKVPVNINFFDDNWNKITHTVVFDGYLDTFQIILPFNPIFYIVDPDEKISHAVTADSKVITSATSINFAHANFILNITQLTDSVFFRAEHHWVGADEIYPPGATYTISPQRYWKIDGIWPSGFAADATISYNGKTSGTAGYMDHLLIGPTEDSLLLLYRPSSYAAWQEWPSYSKNMGSLTDKVGTINIQQIQKGEYALAYKSSAVSLPSLQHGFLNAYPNPAYDQWIVSWDSQTVATFDFWQLTDIHGRTVASQSQSIHSPYSLSIPSLPSGTYYLTLGLNGKKLESVKLLKL